jgi:hypothetical protein
MIPEDVVVGKLVVGQPMETHSKVIVDEAAEEYECV